MGAVARKDIVCEENPMSNQGSCIYKPQVVVACRTFDSVPACQCHDVSSYPISVHVEQKFIYAGHMLVQM